MTIRAVFFDAGGTLMRAYPRLGEVYRQVCLRHGFDISVDGVEAALRAIWRGTDPEFGVTAWQDVNTSDEHDTRMWREITLLLRRKLNWPDVPFEAWFRDLWTVFGSASVWRLYDDVEPVLADLARRGLKIGIISNWDSRLHGIADEMRLTPRMACILASASVGVRKPDAAIFRRALDLAGVSAPESAHVGDTLRDDVEGAAGAGLHAVYLDRSGQFAGPADFPVIRTLDALPAVLGFS